MLFYVKYWNMLYQLLYVIRIQEKQKKCELFILKKASKRRNFDMCLGRYAGTQSTKRPLKVT